MDDPIHDRQFLQGETPIALVKAGQLQTTRTGLLAISSDRRDLHVVTSGEVTRIRLPQATYPIHSVAISDSGVVAYVTERGQLTVIWPNLSWQTYTFDGFRFQGQWGELP